MKGALISCGAVEAPEKRPSARARPSHCLFQDPWWLNAVAPEQWREAKVIENGRVVARMPYLVRERRGVGVSAMPPLTQTLGPWIEPVEGEARRLSRETRLIAEVFDQLPEFDVFSQNWHHCQRNFLPAYWRGYEAMVRYTYVIEDLSDLDAVFSGFRSRARGAVRKAARQLAVRESEDIDELLGVIRLTFQRQSLQLPFERELVNRIDRACRARNASRILIAEDAKGRIHAGMLLVFDDRAAYNLMLGADPALRDSGGQSLLIWEALQRASQLSSTFDFEGSMLKGVENFNRSFGPKQVQYLSLSRHTRRGRALIAANKLNGLVGRPLDRLRRAVGGG